MEKKRLSLKLILLAVLALALLCQSLYLLTHSNGNLGVALVWGLTAFVWALLIFHRPLAAFAATVPGRVVCWVLGLGFGLFFALLAFVALSGYSNQPKGNEKAMVVLGAAVHGSKVSRLLQYRLDAACDYYFQHPDLVIVTTGGQGRGEDLPEGRAMRDYLIAKGVPADHVFAEEKSTSTEENFLFAAEILGEIRAYYVTFPYWDTMLHTLNGFLCAAIGFSLLDILNRDERLTLSLSPVYLALVAFCFSMTIGVLWEFFECTMDQLFLLDMQKDTIVHSIGSVMLDPKGGNNPTAIHNITDVIVVTADGSQIPLGLGGYLDIGILDTMKDLWVNFIGAVVFSIVGYFYVKSRGKGWFARNFIPQVLPEDETSNPQE